MSFAVDDDKGANPIDVTLLGADTVVLKTNTVALRRVVLAWVWSWLSRRWVCPMLLGCAKLT